MDITSIYHTARPWSTLIHRTKIIFRFPFISICARAVTKIRSWVFSRVIFNAQSMIRAVSKSHINPPYCRYSRFIYEIWARKRLFRPILAAIIACS